MESINEQRCQNVIKELVGVREKGIFNKRNYNRPTKKNPLYTLRSALADRYWSSTPYDAWLDLFTWPIRYRPFPSSKCIFFCFLSNKREERDFLLSLFVLLYVELVSFGTQQPTHTHVDTTSLATRHSQHHAALGRGRWGCTAYTTHPRPLLIAPYLLGASWERRAMRSYGVRPFLNN